METLAPTEEAIRATRALRDVLTTLGSALTSGRLTDVLETEPALAAAVSSLSEARAKLAPWDLDRDGAVLLRRELGATSAALARCAALGATLDDVVRERCSTGTYGHAGGIVPVRVPSVLEERV